MKLDHPFEVSDAVETVCEFLTGVSPVAACMSAPSWIRPSRTGDPVDDWPFVSEPLAPPSSATPGPRADLER
jgi:hypothetical protein